MERMVNTGSNSFNGATSFRKWIEQFSKCIPYCDNLFQWSHFFSEMDSHSRLEGMVTGVFVSMEPLLFGNG